MIVCLKDCESILPDIFPKSCWVDKKYYKYVVYRNILVGTDVYNLYTVDGNVKYCGCVNSGFIKENFMDYGEYLDMLSSVDDLFIKTMVGI